MGEACFQVSGFAPKAEMTIFSPQGVLAMAVISKTPLMQVVPSGRGSVENSSD